MSNRKEEIRTFTLYRKHDNNIEDPYIKICTEAKEIDFLQLREHQQNAFVRFSEEQFWLYIASGGSGKSTGACYIGAHDLLTSNRKVIFAVPQTTIAQDFYRNNRDEPKAIKFIVDGEIFNWAATKIFSEDTSETIRTLHKTISKDSKNERVIICSHQTLVAYYLKYKKAELKNTFLIIDEAHHIMIYDDDSVNRLGKLVQDCVSNPPDNFRLGLMTATFFRGDRLSILSDKLLDKFTKYEYPIYRHLEENTEIKSVNYNIALFAGDFHQEIKRLVKRKELGKSFIYVPRSDEICSIGSKEDNTDAVLGVLPKSSIVLNFVYGDKIKQLKNRMVEDPGSLEGVDAIISVGRNKEGSNWVCADTIVMVGNKRSLTEILQIIQRTFRHYPGKHNVTIWHLVPYSFKKSKPEEMREDINNYLKVIFGSMVMADIIQPITLKIPHDRKSKKKGFKYERLDYISEIIPDEIQRYKFYENVMKDSFARFIVDGEEIKIEEKRKVLSDVVRDYLADTNLDTDYTDKIVRQIWCRHAISSPDIQKNYRDVKEWDVDFIEKLENTDPFTVVYNSKSISIREVYESIQRNRGFLPFEEARRFVRKLGLNSIKAWKNWIKKQNKPDKIPCWPNDVYNEFTNWGDWLGTDRIANQNREFLPFKEARRFVRKLGLKSRPEWNRWCMAENRPENIPACPGRSYSEFIGWGDWLGTDRIANQNREFRPFKEAREFVRKLGFKNRTEWQEWCKSGNKPKDIPTNPRSIYKEEWINWGDWLGTGTIAPRDMQFRPFKEARMFVRKLGLKNLSEWEGWCKSGDRPKDIPICPWNTYKEKWIGLGDWLGTDRIANQNREFRPFKEARMFVRKLGLKNRREWKEWCKSGNKPKDIPAAPWKTYKEEWIGLGDWLGTGTISTRDMQFRLFEEAREFVRKLGLKDQSGWQEWCKSGNKPKDIPAAPWSIYKEKWISWGDWLGTGTISTRDMQFRPFKEAREFVRKLGLKNLSEWNKWCKSGNRPKDIPTHPERTYKEEWINWGDWLGTGTIAPRDMQFRPFKEARMFVRKLGLKNRREWEVWCKSGNRPKDIPAAPWSTYKEEWIGLGDWLGISNQ